MNQKEQNEEMEIDLLDLAYMLLDNWHYLLICLLAGALLLNAYSFFCIQPTYQSTSKLYIVSTSDDSVVNLNDLNLGTSLTSDVELPGTEPCDRKAGSRYGLQSAETAVYVKQSDRYTCTADHCNNDRSAAVDGSCRDDGGGGCVLSAGYHEYEGTEHCTACKTSGI